MIEKISIAVGLGASGRKMAKESFDGSIRMPVQCSALLDSGLSGSLCIALCVSIVSVKL